MTEPIAQGFDLATEVNALLPTFKGVPLRKCFDLASKNRTVVESYEEPLRSQLYQTWDAICGIFYSRIREVGSEEVW